ncbi:MAG: tail fiber domain-containing protein [Proteobacteria bacterium]|nr:tail fiber domain-containing protein [Pseudomonadota bacterium]
MKDETTLRIEYLEREISELKRLTKRSERPVSMVSRKSWKKRLPVLLAAVSILSAVGLATAADIPHTFGTGGVISATKFNENFSYIVDRLWDKNGTDLYYNDGGNVGIGTTSPGVKLEVEDTSVEGNLFTLRDSDGQCDHDPDSGTETVTCSSDARLKTDIRDAKPVLDDIMKLRVRDYTVIASGKEITGVVAQEVREVEPELVVEGDDGYLKVSQINYWKLVKAVQELKAENDTFLA